MSAAAPDGLAFDSSPAEVSHGGSSRFISRVVARGATSLTQPNDLHSKLTVAVNGTQ